MKLTKDFRRALIATLRAAALGAAALSAAALTVGTTAFASNTPVDPTPLDGKWAEDVCKSARIEPYRKQEFWGFDSTIVQAINSMVYFAQNDRRCEEVPVFSINTYYEYQPHEMKEKGFTELNLVIEKITLRVNSKELAAKFRKEKACGLKNWRAGREFHIGARKCFGQKFREALDKLYGEYTLDDNLNLIMSKKFKTKAKDRSKGKKQTFIKTEDFAQN